MTGFGRSPELAKAAAGLDLAWLAGLLEAEGTFVAPVPSQPRSPAVACQMNDADVVARVAKLFGTAINEIRRPSRPPAFVTRVRGWRATLLMRDLMPLMGERRMHAMQGILEAYEPPAWKLGFEAAETIRRLASKGVSVSDLARRFDVARVTIRQVRDDEIYATRSTPWRRPPSDVNAPLAPSGMSLSELYWLAGWLEGEGSFCGPPPSDPRRARIMGCTTDEDVAHEVGRLLNVYVRFCHPRRERENGWSPTFRMLKRGRGAVDLMRAVWPLMGTRRRAQIGRALTAIGEGPIYGGGEARTPVREACLDAYYECSLGV